MRTFDSASSDIVEEVLADFFGEKVRVRRISAYLGRNETFEVCGRNAVVKIFHNDAELKCDREFSAYSFLSDRGLPVARCLGRGRISSGDWWLVLERLPGVGWESASPELTQQQNAAVYENLGCLLATFHEVPTEGQHGSLTRGIAPQKYIENVARALSRELPNKPLFQRGAELLLGHKELLEGQRYPSVFVHREMTPRNILLDLVPGETPRISGVFDFERAQFGDPYEDLARVAFYDVSAMPYVMKGYRGRRSLPEYGAIRMRLHLLGLIFDIAPWAHAEDPGYFEQAVHALERLVSGKGATELDWDEPLR
ncbi:MULTISPECIES: aminoglycoside phosphotransferase family protein [unclassified Bradyrhizobium]|uniref:phosphotransferase family protein n=1 Tax=unclassified Bradyrhizobium TaxID=2631580 RepID=UPI0029160F98|nr:MULTISPECIES: aminoglycoside phosphotransferase family protein [unclassified Bradyrhizobium]